MDSKEIKIMVGVLNKDPSDFQSAKVVYEILRKFKAHIVPTEELLRATKVGVAANRQKQHPNADCARLATEIVSSWRRHVKPEKADKKSGKNSKSKSKSKSKSRSRSKSQDPKESSAALTRDADEGKITVPLNDRTWKDDGVDPKRTGVVIRDNGIGLMYNGLCMGAEDSPAHVLKRAIEVEAACRDAFPDGENSADYRHKLRSLYQNLRSQSNPTLRFRVLSGALAAPRLVVLTHEELKSDERRAEDEKLLKENMAKAMVAQVEKSITTALRCGKCGQKKVSYSQAQTRSADEPMTTFCECQHCGNRWKFS